MATSKQATAVQIVLRWCMQQGYVPVVRPRRHQNILESMEAVDGPQLGEDDMAKLASLQVDKDHPAQGTQLRLCWTNRQQLCRWAVACHVESDGLAVPQAHDQRQNASCVNHVLHSMTQCAGECGNIIINKYKILCPSVIIKNRHVSFATTRLSP